MEAIIGTIVFLITLASLTWCILYVPLITYRHHKIFSPRFRSGKKKLTHLLELGILEARPYKDWGGTSIDVFENNLQLFAVDQNGKIHNSKIAYEWFGQRSLNGYKSLFNNIENYINKETKPDWYLSRLEKYNATRRIKENNS